MKYLIGIIILIVIILVLFLRRKTISSDKNKVIKTLVRQAARWSTAANQDMNPMIALLHANYGAGYLWALKDIATDNEIENAIDIDILKFRDAIVEAQDKATMMVAKACPNFAPQESYLTKLAKEG